MKKELTLVSLSMTLGLSLQATDWRQQLVSLNPGVIDSVSVMPHSATAPDEYRSYMIHYHQPLRHEEPELGNLPLRALLTVHNDEDFTQQMCQMYIGGYLLDNALLEKPDEVFVNDQINSKGELAGRYHGSRLMPEHRYFGTSCPENPWESLQYCEAKEAAADFHALLEAMKKVFRGKWAITGVSKGGITTAMQHAFYPDDADCYVPYSGPFLNYYHDYRIQDFYMTHSWTDELNEKMLRLQHQMTSSEDFFSLYCLSMDIDPEDVIASKKDLCKFALSVGSIDLEPRAYNSREEVKQIFENNESVLRQLGLESYSVEMMLYMVVEESLLLDQNYFDWYNKYFETEDVAENGPRRAHARLKEGVKFDVKHRLLHPDVRVDKAIWDADPYFPYSYQAIHELGYFDMKWNYYFDDQEYAEMLNEYWRSLYNNVREAELDGLFDDVEYNPELFTFVRQQTANAEKPILFIYGEDDVWTGAHMEDENVNGDNVRLYILPAQNHRCNINAIPDDELKQELWAFIDPVFASTPVSISTLRDESSAPACYYDLYGRRVSEQSLQGRIVLKR